MVSMGKGERKRLAKGAIAASLAKKGIPLYRAPPVARPKIPSTPFRFLDLPIELRFMVYDKLAIEERTLGIRINLDCGKKPQARAYSDSTIQRTCSLIREEYAQALEHRVKGLLTEHAGSRFSSEYWVMDPISVKRYLRIVERKVSKGVYAQDDAWTTVIPFIGRFDHGFRWSNLVVTIASSADANYNTSTHATISYQGRHEPAWEEQRFDRELARGLADLHKSMRRKDWQGCVQWRQLWEEYNDVFSRATQRPIMKIRFPTRFGDGFWD